MIKEHSKKLYIHCKLKDMDSLLQKQDPCFLNESENSQKNEVGTRSHG